MNIINGFVGQVVWYCAERIRAHAMRPYGLPFMKAMLHSKQYSISSNPLKTPCTQWLSGE
jgi:hypothetical protein